MRYMGVVLGNGGGNCIGAGTGGPGIGPEKGAGYDPGMVLDEDCSFGPGPWFTCAACNEVFCTICGTPDGKGEEECTLLGILLSIFIGVLTGGNCNCP